MNEKALRLFVLWSAVVLLVLLNLTLKGDDALKWQSVTSIDDVADTVVYQTASDFDGKHYKATIRGDDLRDSPKWKDSDEPPLRVSQIKANARNAFQKQFPKFNAFKITSVNFIYLNIVDRWVVQVDFSDTDAVATASEDKRVPYLVLLTGKVIDPAVSSR